MIPYKQLPEADILSDFATSGFKFKTRPRCHQLRTLAWVAGENHDRVSFLHDIGTGKTLTALYTNLIWGAKKTLVVCPTSVISTWSDQIQEHTDWSSTVLLGDTKDRQEVLCCDGYQVYITNYPGLRFLCGKQGQRKGFVPDFDLCKLFHVDSVIFDESHSLKSATATCVQAASLLSQFANHAITMTGSPISIGEHELWSEYYVLDSGRSLGPSYKTFLKSYFTKGHFPNQYFVFAEGRQRILERIAPVTLRYAREECSDLPPKTYQTRHVEMSKEQGRLTNAVVGQIALELEHGTLNEVKVLNQGNKLAQIAAGFVIGTAGPVRLKENPKLDELDLLLDEIDGQFIVFHEYDEEAHLIEELLRHREIGFASLRSEVKDHAGEIRRFQTDRTCRVCVAHSRSGGVGINFQNAQVAVFYTSGYDGAIGRPQCEGRIWRDGQLLPCLIIDIIMTHSVDERKYAVRGRRASMSDVVLSYVKERGNKPICQ
jgi:SNF2 family DNA or RNA helicase